MQHAESDYVSYFHQRAKEARARMDAAARKAKVQRLHDEAKARAAQQAHRPRDVLVVASLPVLYDAPIGPSTPIGLIVRDLEEGLITQPIAARRMARWIAETHRVSLTGLFSARREAPVVRARQELMWLMKEHLTWSLPHIGRFLGDRDHTTVLHGVRKHQERLDAAKAALALYDGSGA